MQAVILAAGLGTRLRPIIGEDIPKVMVNLNGKPLLEYTVEILKSKGIREITIIVHHKKEQIINHFEDEKKFGLSIYYFDQKNPKGGTADAVNYARGKITDEKFLLLYGDNVFDPDIIDTILKEHSKFDGLIAVKEMHDVSKYGVVEVENNRVVRIVEKPETPISNLVLTGLFVLPSAIFDFIDKVKPSKRNERELTDAIQLLINSGFKIGYIKTQGFWMDPRDAKELEVAKQFVRENYGG